MNFEFISPARIIFGAGSLREVGAIVRGYGTHTTVVTGRDPHRAEPLLHILKAQGVGVDVFSFAGEPELATIVQGTLAARVHGAQSVIGFGGGSALDAAKAIAAMLSNDGELLDYVEIIGRGKALLRPAAPFVAIPTTAGTGSEVTRNAVLGSPEHRLKVSLRSPLMLARAAICDPGLTCGLPPAITASTGLDALTQLIEPYVCSRANPMTDALCAEGMRRVARSLRAAFADGHNLPGREDMMLAGLCGGLALANAGLGAVHGFAGPVGGKFLAPHGAVCAALLPHVMHGNLRALRARAPGSEALRRHDEVARLLTGDASATADAGVAWVEKLVADLQIPPLRAYGIKPEHVADLVSKAANASSMKANPIGLTEDELSAILQMAM